ncbi:MAG TPA: hypothetical protein VF533_19240 [Solirubrobacteraceae bacterium]
MKDRFAAYARRPPSRTLRVLGVLSLAFATVGFWDARGAVVGVVALLTYGAIALALMRPEVVNRWSQMPLVVDTALMIPLGFIAAAYVTDLGLWACAAIGVAAWLLQLVHVTWRRRRR